MAFHDIRFPASLSFGALGGPERRTEIVTLASGHEERNTPWAHGRRRWDAGLGLRSLDDLEVLIAFFEARRGPLHGFRWKDWADHRSAPAAQGVSPHDQWLGTGDGERRAFALLKGYHSGEASYLRPIVKPVQGSVQVAIADEPCEAGLDFVVDHATGIVSFAVAPPLGTRVSAGFEFDVPVRFAQDRIAVSVASFNAGEAPDVPVLEIRL